MEKKTYIDEKVEKFRALLLAGDADATLAYFKDTVIGSYKNGIKTHDGKQKREAVKMDSAE